MTIHRVGYSFILKMLAFILALDINIWLLKPDTILFGIFAGITFVLFILIIYFFRKPKREIKSNDNYIFAPADGTVVVVEETFETEYFKDMRVQISIFMSPLNVHINWIPVGGVITYFRYHQGMHLCAWKPKASTENERSTFVIRKPDGTEILVRQIAGALAKRIVSFRKENDTVQQNKELGFIKFGSRVDVFLPVGTKINVTLDQEVKGTQTVLAEFAT